MTNLALMSRSSLHFRCSMLRTPQQTCSRRKKNLRSSLTGRRHHFISSTLVTNGTFGYDPCRPAAEGIVFPFA